MKIIDNRKEKTVKEMLLSDIPVSTTFTGELSGYTGLFLRTYDEVVFLEDPSSTWDAGSLVVSDYSPVNVKVTITSNAT